jgi:hypothetical protein
MVFRHLTVARETTFAAVADDIIRSTGSSATEDRAVRRRVYDILNVLHACRMVDKTKTHIRITSSAALANGDHLAEKRKRLAERFALLVRYHALIERNRRIARPPRAIQLPALFVSFRNLENGSTARSLDSRSLTVISEAPPRFYSPMDILSKFSIDREQEERTARSIGIDPSIVVHD